MKKLNFTWLASPLLLTLVLLACSSNPIALFAEPTPTATLMFVTPTPTTTPATPTFTPTPSAEPTATSTPTPALLTVTEIFARVSPSVAFIETPIGTGSGVLTEGGYVVTNAHVVWPFQEVRVVFPDGSEFRKAPVAHWDLLGDLAIISLLHTSINPVALVDGEDLIIGSDVFLIGYPGEVEQFPQPTITRGLISRRREWEPMAMTYFQTDATIAGGQSGGVLVSKTGEVIGISGFSFTEGGFGLVASAADVLPRLQKLIDDEDIAGLGERWVPLEGGRQKYDFTLRHFWDTRTYVINEPIGTTIDLKVEGENDAALGLIDVFGNTPLLVNEGVSGVETGSVTTEWTAPYFVLLGQSAEEPGDFHVSSNHRLIPYDDVDDGTRISIGQTGAGSIDYPGDADYFVIDLDEGDTIDLAVDSILIDPVLSVDYLEAKEEELISDDNSGGGFFGLNAALTYRAPHSGSYFIVVGDQPGYGIGGYFLTVAAAPLGTIPANPRPTSSSTEEPTTLGPNSTTPMKGYKSAQYPFAMQYPAQWAKQPQEEGMTAAYAQDSAGLFIAEEDLATFGAGDMTLEEYMEVVLFVMAQEFESFELILRQQIVTNQGLPVEVIVFTGGPGNIYKASRLVYVHENKVGFSATYLAPRAKYQELEALIDSSFSTFEIME